jgi:uncharacterized protein YraI
MTMHRRETIRARALAAAAVSACFGLAAPSAFAQAQAYTSEPVDLYAGPSGEYPVVTELGPNVPVTVMGCVSDYSWCDVALPGLRGWIYGGYLTYPYQGGYVPLEGYGAAIGLPVVTFAIGAYWGSFYRDRPWYGDRDRWAHVPPPGYGARPPGPPPMHGGQPGGGHPPPSAGGPSRGEEHQPPPGAGGPPPGAQHEAPHEAPRAPGFGNAPPPPAAPAANAPRPNVAPPPQAGRPPAPAPQYSGRPPAPPAQVYEHAPSGQPPAGARAPGPMPGGSGRPEGGQQGAHASGQGNNGRGDNRQQN